ncbi:hypothetical protein HOD08_00260 [bacterium]|jgi:bifunctional oligoribonuclease and PAP phosphatase NrnA|nr:hypothetical protein [bacterium]
MVGATQSTEAWKLLSKAEKIIILGHRNPDGDSVASCAALSSVLMNRGAEVEIVHPTEIPARLQFLKGPHKIGEHSIKPDVIVALDIAEKKRTYFPETFEGIPLINIDHHECNPNFGDLNIVDGKASSAAEVLYGLLKEWDPRCVTIDIANDLLFGILADSIVFQTTMTSAKTLRESAELIDMGANLRRLSLIASGAAEPEKLKFWSEVIGLAREVSPGLLSVAIPTTFMKEKNQPLKMLEGFVNFAARNCTAGVVVVFSEQPSGAVKVSMRSHELDVAKIAAKYGGGGHKNAAGALSKAKFDELVPSLLAEIESSM